LFDNSNEILLLAEQCTEDDGKKQWLWIGLRLWLGLGLEIRLGLGMGLGDGLANKLPLNYRVNCCDIRRSANQQSAFYP